MKGLFLVLCVSVTVFATATTTKNVMGNVFQSFLDLIPYINNEMKFRDSSNETLIRNNLHKLHNSFKNAKHLKSMKSPGFKPSYDVIVQHLDHTVETFDSGNKVFARSRLKATAQICMSCHSQLKTGASARIKRQLSKVSRSTFSSDYDYADFLFLTRNYNKSEVFYRKEIRNRIAKNKKLRKIHTGGNTHFLDYTIEKSLRKLVTLYTKINYNPKKAITLIDEYKSNKDLSKAMISDLLDWREQLVEWDKKKFSGKISARKDLDSFLNKYLRNMDVSSVADGSEDITLLVSSGVLYRYLNMYPKSGSAPELLYYLSVVDKQLNFNYLYSLSSLYLKQCITQYSKSEMAKKCFNKYKSDIEFGYTGSAGTFIPKDEKAEIKRLQKYITN